MKMVKTLMAALVAVVLTVGLAGMASAAAISCGDCHGTPPVDSDNCTTDARGLHGTHYNYSSTALPKSAALDAKCAYCHTDTTGTAPTTTHNNNYVNVTSTTKATGLAYDGGTSTCTNACHKNEAATAKWGNYTSVATINLTCNSCHDDSSASTMDLTGAHAAHFGTAITTGTNLDNSDNTQCAVCHPDNANDLWSAGMADDGSKKAYPHASDGTNVVSANAELNAGMSHTTCTSACHSNVTTDNWTSGTLTCTSCHSDDAGTGTALTSSHTAHFTAGKTCTDCHGTLPTTTAHATALPVVADNASVTLVGGGSFTDATNTCSNGTGTSCHANTSAVWGAGTLGCTSCHYYDAAPTSAGNTAATVSLTGSHSAHFAKGKLCSNCHTEPVTNAHYVSLPVTADNATITLAAGTFTDATNTCTNTGAGCHLTGSPVWGSGPLDCTGCHSYPDGNNWAADTGHAVQYDTAVNPRTHLPLATSFNRTTDTFAAVVADTAKCGKCHSGATHQNGSVNVTSTGMGYNNCGTGDFTINVNTSGSNVTCDNVSCHSGKTTPNWY